MEIMLSKKLKKLLSSAVAFAEENAHQVFTLEHVFYILSESSIFASLLEEYKIDAKKLTEEISKKLASIPKLSSHSRTIEGRGVRDCMMLAANKAAAKNLEEITLTMFLLQVEHTSFSCSAYDFIKDSDVDYSELISEYGKRLNEINETEPNDEILSLLTNVSEFVKANPEPFVGRDEEIDKTIKVLHRKHKNNALHVGEPGVGKTALLYGLADLINKGAVPEKLKNNTVYSLEMGAAVAGTQFRGDFEKRMKSVLDFLKKKGNCILYIDEIHSIIGSGSTSGNALDGANILKPYLLDGSIKFIGATTFEEYKKYFAKDKALSRRFQVVEILEPSIEDCVTILKGSKRAFEDFHSVEYTDEAIEAAVKLSSKYIKERFLPDKAIDLIDEAGANINASNPSSREVGREMIEKLISKNEKLPLESVGKSEIERLKTLDADIKSKVFGQDEAIDKIVESIMLSRAGLGDTEKPVGSYLFVGPTGVGKTEIAKQLSSSLGINLIRFDMSEYMEEHSVAKLIGAPAGYVGYEDGGLLVEKVRKTPHCVLLFDEIEKAHSKVYNALLQVLDYGTLTDSQGRVADFRNSIIIFTSNCGAHNATKKSIGFEENSEVKTNVSAITEAVNETFSPEFRNRLSGIIHFNALSNSMAEKIIDKYLSELKDKLAEKNCTFKISEVARQYLIDEGITDEYGARELIRVIEKKVKPLFVSELLFGKLSNGGSAVVDYSEEKGLFLSNVRGKTSKTKESKKAVKVV